MQSRRQEITKINEKEKKQKKYNPNLFLQQVCKIVKTLTRLEIIYVHARVCVCIREYIPISEMKKHLYRAYRYLKEREFNEHFAISWAL